MRISYTKAAHLRPTVLLALSGLLALSLTAPSGGASGTTVAAPSLAAAAVRAAPTVTLKAVGPRYVGARIPIRGAVRGVGPGKHRLALQRFSTARHRWTTRAVKYVPRGSYRFRAQTVRSPGWVRFRTVLHRGGKRLAVSNVIRVQIMATPIGPTPVGPTPVDPTPAPRPTCASSPSPATCIKPVDQQPAGAALPDVRIKDLTKCGLGDMEATDGTCFKIVQQPDGRKLLKFGVITFNVGDGPGEVIADRSAADSTDWKGYQNFYDVNGNLLGSTVNPGVQFYYAGDGHNHWHVLDFDEYALLDASGDTIARGEKHGYCMQDNTSYGPMRGLPGVASEPTYAEATSCGKALPQALTVVHGLSRGWGDTYPVSLPQQAIDITGMPDGAYTVRVHADAVGALNETDETNNVAEVKVQITGDTVTVLPGTSTGGLP